MGCNSSKSESPVPVNMVATGGGSIILSPESAVRVPTDPGGESGLNPDGTMIVTRGGSYVIGRKYAGAWEPGTSIVRPDTTLDAQYYYLPINPTTVLRLSYASGTEQGRSPKPPQKPNQDSFIHITALGNNPSVALFGVFDGHGPKGEDASNYCTVNLSDIIVRSATFTKTPFDAFQRSFETAHRRFISPETQKAGVDTTVSGTTAVAVLIHGNQYMCANVGDSRAIMGSVTNKGTLLARPLSMDHKPNRPDERARILASSARILSERQLGIEGGDTDKFYVCRVHSGNIRYGVLFTRSIGDADAHAHLGLTSTPEVKTGKLTAQDKFIVVATDGVWDVLGEEEVARLVQDANEDAQIATLSIVQTAKARWDRDAKGRRDDITAVVVLLNFMSAAEAQAEQEERAGASKQQTSDTDVTLDVGAQRPAATQLPPATADVEPAVMVVEAAAQPETVADPA